MTIIDASEFAPTLAVDTMEFEGYRIIRMQSAAVPNAIAGFCLWVRDQLGVIPHVYFAWTEGNPVLHALRFVFFGEGDIPPVTREIIRRAERVPSRRPGIHVS